MTTKEKASKIIRYHIDNPDCSLKEIGEIFGLDKSSVSPILSKYYDIERKIYVVGSLLEENTYFIFNGINERKFTVNVVGLVDERHLFTKYERTKLMDLGFSF